MSLDTGEAPLPNRAPAPERRPESRQGERPGAISGAEPLAWAALAVAALFTVPIGAVVANLFRESEGTWQHLAQTVLPNYVASTLWLALGVGIGVTLIGTSTAWLVTMCRFPGRRVFEWALILPLAVPAYVLAYAYTDALQYAGPVQGALRELTGWQARDYWFPQIRSLGGAVAMLTLALYPYVYLMARAAFLEQSVCALEVSRTLGCSFAGSFWRVALPTARPAIVAGAALALMETLADYGTVSFFSVQTFTTGVVRAWTAFGDPVAAGQLASVLLGFVFFAVLLERHARSRARFHHTSRRHQRLPRQELSAAGAAGAVAVCALPILLGFLTPAGILLEMNLRLQAESFGPRYLQLAANSATLAGVTAVAAVFLALVIGYAARLAPGPWTRLAQRVAALGYAVPGAVIAVGVLIPAAAFDNALDGWMRANLGVSTGLIFTGTIAALVFAYLVRFLAISINAVEAGLGKIQPSLDDAARTLGRRPLAALVRIHVPLIRGTLLTAGLIVFVDVMKELPATLIMRPFNFDTLAVQAYNFASDERLAESAVPSLTIVVAGLLPVVLLTRSIARSRVTGGTP